MIYATVNMTVGDYSSTCDQNIVLYRGDKNVEIRFVIKGNRFTVLDSTYAQMIIRRPSSVSIFSEPAAIQNDTVIFTITEDMVDELKEVGEYTFQIRLYDNSMNARATLPPCNNCLIINQPIAVEGEALVNAAMVNASAILAAESDIPEDEIFTEDNAYNRTVWMDGDIITDARMNKIENALYYINEKGGGGTATAPYISTSLPETVMVGSGEDFELDLDFSSPNLGKGTLKVFINDVDSMNLKIDQGMTISTIPGSLFSKGTNMVVIYVLDRVGMMSNSLTFYIRYGGTEVTSTFDAYVSYDYGATVRYYFTPTALDTSLQLTFYMEIDGTTQAGVPCISDVRSYYTFPTNLSVGNHYCRAWVTDGTTRSNVLTFNLIILDATSLVVATDTLNTTVEEGTQLVLDYKVYMKNNTSFITKTYVDNNLINTGTCTLETAYYRTTNLTAGTHTIKVEVFDVTETYTDFVTWTVTVTESTYTMLEPAKAGSTFIATAYNKSNVDENREVWIGTNQDNDDITASLSNFSFNSENGWVDDSLVISGNSWVEIPIQPLANNAQYGFTLDIEFSTKPIGVEDAEVLTLWNETDNCGIKITTEQLIMRSKTGNQCDLYFPEDEIVSAIFVIDRDEKTAKIYLNGVMCEAFALSDYEAAGQKYLEDFTVNSNIFLGGYNKNGYCAIKNIRIYEVALATNEILINFMSNEKDKAAQRELVEFQKGNTLPTLTIYCDFAGLGKDDKKPCNIVYNSPDVNLYGESFTLDGKHSMLQYQGTSSMQYPIKNYRINPRNADGKVKLDPFNNGVGESRFTLKADFMSSGHWQNTGMAKFVNDCLYNYNPNDEKSMNPAKWWSLQNGGSLKDTRETINGFPCRLILVNDGETALNEGQQEPTPGNTKDMGVFNFNNDKDNVNTLGLDTEIFPNCISYEVTANSDTSAGAFVPYDDGMKIPFYFDETSSMYSTAFLTQDFFKTNFSNPNYGSGWVNSDVQELKLLFYNSDFLYTNSYMNMTINGDTWNNQMEKYPYGKFSSPTMPTYLQTKSGVIYKTVLRNKEVSSIVWEYSESDITELEYLQNSFELRYPDEDDVGKDYGYLGLNEPAQYIDYWVESDMVWTTYLSYTDSTIKVTSDTEIYRILCNDDTRWLGDVSPTSGIECNLIDGTTRVIIRFKSTAPPEKFYINDVLYYSGDEVDGYTSKDPYTKNVLSSNYGLKRVIDWVGNCTDEEFVADFEKYFNKQYVLRYYLLVIVCGMVDNLGKNMMLDTWDGQIWYPRFYDMDTICSYDNSGEIKFDVDIEMAQGYWNTSSSGLWTKVRDLFHDDLVATYKDLRQNNFSYEKFMSYFYGKQIAQIPQTYYNKDYDVKYAPYANEYMGKAHGDGYEHLKRWLKRRLIFTDTLFDYAPSYENDKITIRANTLEPVTIEIETYTPVYQHVSFWNGNMEKAKIDGKASTSFTKTLQAATDQEVMIYGGSNIKRLRGISSFNPDSMLIGNASKLVELDISDCPILTVVNSNKANFSPHTYLNKLDISNCPQLGGQLNISNSPLLQEVNALGTSVDNILFPTSVRNLETLRVPKTVTSLTLNDAGLLYTIEMEEGNNLQSIALTNCNNLTETINFDLTKTPTVLLDNSFNGEELYMSATTNLTLKNMPSLRRVIFTPNSEYSEFDINNVINGASYKVTTFNNPMMTDFITTADNRLSNVHRNKKVVVPPTCIENDGTAYLNTKYTPKNNTKIVLDAQMTYTKTYAHWLGCEGQKKVQYGSTTSFVGLSQWSVVPSSIPTTRQTYTITANESTYELLIFCGYANDAAQIDYIGVGKIYSMKIYEGDTLVHDYVPAMNGDIATLYDNIDNTYLEVVGTLLSDTRIAYPSITPNTAFTANTLDLADTQFQNVKFLCTTDIYNLKVPTTMKNFYCDSAFDIDTDVIEDASYEVIHNTFIKPYTTNYENDVRVREEGEFKNIVINDWTEGGYLHAVNGGVVSDTNCKYTDYYIEVVGGTQFDCPNVRSFIQYDENYTCIYASGAGRWLQSNTKYVRISVENSVESITVSYTGVNYRTPNIIPSSASGSLIFNMYSNNTTQPTSTSPYMWDLTGLKLEDFYTYGMNNWVKPNDGAIANVGKDKVTIYPKYAYRGSVGNKATIGNDNGMTFGAVSPLKVKQGDSIKVNIQKTFKYAIVDSQDIVLAETTNTGAWSPIDTVVKITQPNADRLLIQAYPNGSPVDKVYFNDILFYTNVVTLTSNTAVALIPTIEPISGGNQLVSLESITMPQRMSGYSVRLVNADITPDEYPTMLYPKLIDTTLPITGKLDYTKYNGSSLAWAYAYTTGDVTIDPLDSRSIGQITYDYNKLYGTDFVDIVDIWVYKDTDVSKLSTNEAITKAYIELTKDNGTTRLNQILPYYPNCTDLYFFEDGSITALNNLFDLYVSKRKQILNVTFMDGYFENLINLNRTFKGASNLQNVNNIPKTVIYMQNTFENCSNFNQQLDLSELNISKDNLSGTFIGCSSLTHTPILPSNYTGSMQETFRNCTSLTQAPVIPQGVTNMNDCFNGCKSLIQAPELSHITGSVGLQRCFQDCTNLTTVPSIPPKAWGYLNCFRNCTNLTTVPTNGWRDVMNSCFQNCISLNQLIVLSDEVTTMQSTFNGCTSLTIAPTIPVSVTDGNYCFSNCTALVNGANIQSTSLKMTSFYANCSNLQTATIPFDAITDYQDMLSGCGKLTDITWTGERTKNFNFSYIGKNDISQADIQELVPEHLATVESATLTLGDYLSHLTEDEIAQATAKGWTIQ